MTQSGLNLLKQRTFLPLFLTQFFGAFNDNAFKLAMLTLISYILSHSQIQSEKYQAIAGALFSLPFFVFSATFGQIADQYDKSFLIRWIKLFELLLMSLGAVGLYHGNIFLLMTVLTGMGIHSTFFGPIKYSILPDHLAKEKLLDATGLVEASTFIAILLGTVLGSLSVGTEQGSIWLAIVLTMSAALAGLCSSFFIPAAPPHEDHRFEIDWNIFRATYSMLVDLTRSRQLFVPVLTISWFWLIGAVILTKLPDYTHFVLGANNQVFAFFLALFSIGIASGSMVISRFLKGELSLKYVPLSMMFLSVFAFDLFLASPKASLPAELYNLKQYLQLVDHWRIAFDLFLLAFSAGLFVVPLYTHLQVFSAAGSRARTIAVNNIYNAFFMVLGTLLVMLLIYLHCSIPQVFLVVAILNAVVALLLFRRRQPVS